LDTLLDYFDRYVRGNVQAVVFDDGFRVRTCTQARLRGAAERFAARIASAGVVPGDRLLIWSENRPEWIAAFWGCVLQGVVVIPVDPQASPELLGRILAAAKPRAVLTGEDVRAGDVPASCPVWPLRGMEWPDAGDAAAAAPPRTPARPDSVAEIVFTSGTTGEPKGVVITHGNILANILPIEREARRYQRYLWPLRPLRFLDLLPLSHMFGQALAMFLPPLVSASTVFMRGHNPDQIIDRIRRHRVTLLVAVPRVLEMLRDRVRLLAPGCDHAPPVDSRLPVRLWRGRSVRRLFGWRFCGFVVGAAQLDRSLEEFWARLGFVVAQGYGLTETAPIVAWNNPFSTRRGSVGAPLEGIEVRLAQDGEILVRGPNVTAGYLNAPEETRIAFEGGWFHTGDIGAFDDEGRLVIRGRKKDVIVTPEGLNVYPEDVERVLASIPGVRDAAVVGKRVEGVERVHAVLVLDAGTDPAAVVRDANARVESHQRIRGLAVWPGRSLPRTDTLRKLKRHEIRDWVEHGEPSRPPGGIPRENVIEQLLARYAEGRPLGPDTTLEELGLTSLDRIELQTALESRTDVALDEAAVAEAKTLADIDTLVRTAATAGGGETFEFPGWTRSRPARVVRRLNQITWILPLSRWFLRLHVTGREHLLNLRGPVVFAANHQSHFDTPAVLDALPGRWRHRIAVPMSKNFFDPHFRPEGYSIGERLVNRALYYVLVLLFNAFPLPQTEPGVRRTLQYIGELADAGVSLLIFPEGHRTDRGEIGPFQPGVGMIASKLRLAVVPVRLDGVHRVLHRTWWWPRRGHVGVAFGAPLILEGSDYAALAARVRGAVLSLISDVNVPDAA
jgi:long-chain acyl-CoA synthetase